jgi:hypothetical protein
MINKRDRLQQDIKFVILVVLWVLVEVIIIN